MHCTVGRRFAFLIFFFTFSALSFSQGYLVHRYSETDGLPNITAHDVTQDHWGRIWVATRSGIAVYDGISWETYTIAEGLPMLAFSKITVDHRGKIWALADSTHNTIVLLCHDGTRWHQMKELKIYSSKSSKMTALHVVEQKQKQPGKPLVAVGTSNHGVFLWNRERWENITEGDGLLSNSVNGMASLEGKLYVATDNGLSIITSNLTIDNQLNQSLRIPSDQIKAIVVEYKGKYRGFPLKHSRIWLSGHQWLGYLEEAQNGMKMTVYPVEITLVKKESGVILLPDYRGGLFVGSQYKLNYFNYKTHLWETMDVNSGLTGAGANSLFIDFEKNIWIACDRGISKIVSRRFSNFQMPHGLLEDEVTAVVEYAPGKFVLGHNYGFTFYDGKKFLKMPFPQNEKTRAPLCRVLDMQLDSKNNIWMALAWAGLAKVNPRNKRKVTWYGKAHGLPGYVLCLWIDKENTDNVWLGTGRGIFLGRENENGFMAKKVKITSATTDPNPKRMSGFAGKLRHIASHNHGVYVYIEGKNKWKNYRVPNDEKANAVYAIKKDSKGRLLIGTLKGVYVLENEGMKKFWVNGFQVDRPVYFILEDKKNRLWFGTDNGVVRWDGKEKRRYSVGEGLIGQETNRAAGIVDSRGRVWIGTNRGVSIYNEEFDSSRLDVPAPKVQLLHMEVSGKKIPLKKPAQLSYEENTVVFYFQGISFIDEAAIRFKTKLEGFENEWLEESYSHNPMKRYINLPAGTYRFYLKARNAVGVWSDVVTSPGITILKPLYRRWWFLLSVFLAVSFVFYSIFRFFSERRHAGLLKKQVEERTHQLQTVEQRYRTLFEESKDAVFISTPGGRLIDINPAGVELFGFTSKDEILSGKYSVDFNNTPGGDPTFRETIEKKGYVKNYELILKGKDGKKINGLVTANLVRDKEGNISAYRGIIRDITEKKHLEQRLNQAQKLEAIGTLAGGIAHDFNNILGVIVGYSELALEDLPADTLVHDNIQNVLTAADRAAELVKQILAFSRQGDGKRRPLNICLIVKETLKLLRSSLPATIEIRQNVRAASDIVLADPTEIRQVLMNLCTNAAHAMEANGGVLEVNLGEIYLDTETVKRHGGIKTGAYLRLTVSDTGHGMPGIVAKRIFDPYFTTKKTGKGSGMGLAVIHGIIKNLGGDITVYSEPGKGSTFHVFLPRFESKTEPKNHVTTNVSAGNERILLVDDEELLVQVETEILERLGYEVVAKSSAVEALEVFRSEPERFDLVVTDLTMPHMTGTQLAKRVRHIKPGIPIILCSGFGDIDANIKEKEGIDAVDVSDFVTKPIIKNDLARIVRKALDKSK